MLIDERAERLPVPNLPSPTYDSEEDLRGPTHVYGRLSQALDKRREWESIRTRSYYGNVEVLDTGQKRQVGLLEGSDCVQPVEDFH